MQRLDASLRLVGTSYQAVAPEVEAYLTKLQRTTRYSDEDAREALTRLIALTGNYGQSLKDMQVVIDLAAFKQISLSDAANIVAKAHQGVGRELKAFGLEVKAGIDLVPQLSAKLKDYEANSRGMGDQLKIVNNLWIEFKEQLGFALIAGDNMSGGMTRLQKALVDMQKWVENNAGAIGDFVNGIIRAGEFIADFSRLIVEHTPNWYTIPKWIKETGQNWGLLASDAEKSADKQVKAGAAVLSSSYLNAQRGLALAKTTGEDHDKLTDEQIKAREKKLKDSHKNLEDLQRIADKSALELLTAQGKAYEEVERQFREKMKGMTAADYKTAEALLKETHKNQLFEWAGFTETTVGQIRVRLERTIDANLKTGASFENLSEVIVRHGVKVTAVQAAYYASIGVIVEVGKALTEEQKARIASALAADQHRSAIVRDTDAIASAAGKMNEFAQGLRGASPALAEFADKMEALSGGITNIAKGIGKIASGDVIGGISQGISGIVGLVSMFTGESESSRRVRIALEQAREAIQHNTRALGDLSETDTAGRVVAGIKSGLESFFASFQRSTMTPYLTASQESQLSGALSARGVSLADLESLARDYGVTLRPQGTGIHAGLLKEFLKLVGGLDTGIPTDFGSQLRQIQDNARLRGDSSQQLLDAILGLVTGPYGSPFLASAFAGKSPQQILSALPGIAQNRGAVGAAGLGGLNLAQFDQVINLLADTIRSIAAPAGGVPALPPLPTPTLPPMGNPLGGISFMPNAPVLLPAPVGNTSVQSTIASLTVNVVPSEWNVEDIAQTVGTSVGTVLAAQAAAIDQILANTYRSSAQSRGNVTLT